MPPRSEAVEAKTALLESQVSNCSRNLSASFEDALGDEVKTGVGRRGLLDGGEVERDLAKGVSRPCGQSSRSATDLVEDTELGHAREPATAVGRSGSYAL